MIVIASLFAAATVAAATVTAAIAASASAQNQNATESARAAVCAMTHVRTAMRVVTTLRVGRVATYGYTRTVRRGPLLNILTLSAVPGLIRGNLNTATDTDASRTRGSERHLHTALYSWRRVVNLTTPGDRNA